MSEKITRIEAIALARKIYAEAEAGRMQYAEREAAVAFDEIDRLNATIDALKAKLAAAVTEARKWRRIRTPTHGPCCTCQKCGENYDDCRCSLDDVADELVLVAAERDRLRVIANRLPKTADGVPVVPGMTLWRYDDHNGYCAILDINESLLLESVSECYSTREAAEAALKEQPDE